MINLLNTILDFSLLEQGYSVGLDWLGHFARVIIEGVGIIGLGIIVFTIVLKAITLPFDIYQRVKMRKQTLIMRQMQPELEKLQKQYANDKNMYSQKMMELYKKNGYSMFGACLPMIISLVIIIVAFQGFRTYSSYANLNMYVKMSEAYNSALSSYIVEGLDYRLPVEGEEDTELTIAWNPETPIVDAEKGITYTMAEVNGTKIMQVTSDKPDKFIYYNYSLEGKMRKEYKLDTDKLLAYNQKLVADKTPAEFVSEAVAAAKQSASENGGSLSESQEKDAREKACKDYAVKIGATAAKEWYLESDSSFLWVKNVWYPDVSYEHPIKDYSGFKKSFGDKDVVLADGTEVELTAVFDETRYDNLVSELGEFTEAPNGYFILIILSIGFMVLSQILSMKSSKESNQYQTVDGSGARSQKMMLIIMPLIYGIFAFFYSAAFSIYMTMSSIISIIVMLLSNLILGRVFKKKEEEALKEKYTRRLPWQTQGNNDKKDKKSKKK